MRLIDADKLIQFVDYSADLGGLWGRMLTAFKTIIKEVVNIQPTIEPERTGHWINGHWDGDSNFRIDGRGNCWFVRECSNCHEEIQGKPTKYCPNCGCCMKEGEEHD